MAELSFDLVVLGGGPGGYVAAIRAAQLGLSVACVDENDLWGGTCLRVGCIPSKALLESTHLLEESQKHFGDHGIQVSDITFDVGKMLQRKASVVDALCGGIKMLLKKNKVTGFQSRGRLLSATQIQLTNAEKTVITGKHILLATGSLPMKLPGIAFDNDLIGDSTTALSYPTVPQTLIVIGGGYIGLELGSVWRRLGSKVIILEAMDRVLSGLDGEIAKIAVRTFEKQGLEFRTQAFVEEAKVVDGKCVVRLKSGEVLHSDRVLACAGRVPNTKDLGLEALGIQTDRRGAIVVDADFRTNVPSIFAIGDCIGGAMLAHKASEEGVACVEKLVTGFGKVDYHAIPAIVYTHPEIGCVGKTEEQLKDEGIEYKRGVCPYGANGRARALGDTDGRVKILADAKTDRILGVHAIGSRAGDLIAEVAVAMSFSASAEDLGRCVHAHPTLSEIVKEAALAVHGEAIHTA
ncbi:MAG: dihydrolipoyl dehydrogenase [Planctomycetaceae bacterium]|nr:dihydrolipoyl dehydrogenase [Planctomycetaceae bacterium]